MPAVRCLSTHASYACRRTGVCCASDWPVPVESDQLVRLRRALASGQLAAGVDQDDAFEPPPPGAPAEIGGVLRRQKRRCVFLAGGPDATCGIHAALGHEALPLACRQFPRIAVRDPRGVSITLSHYCPTAARRLWSEQLSGIDDRPVSFPPDGDYDGLDASRALPPLLRPDLLMDWGAWWEWERLAIGLLDGDGAHEPALALGRLRDAVERVRRWRPADGPLLAAVRETMAIARRADARPFRPDAADVAARVTEIVEATPAELAAIHRHTLDAGMAPAPDAVVCRFLSAHAFANWHVQLGQGLRTWLRSVEAAYVLLLAGLDVRHADLWLRHLADVHALARTWSRSEHDA